MFSYTCMYGIFLYMYVRILLRCVIGLTITLDCCFTSLLTCDASFLVCSLPSYVFPQVSKRNTHSTFLVLEPFMHLPWLAALLKSLLPKRTSCSPQHTTMVKEILYEPLLGCLLFSPKTTSLPKIFLNPFSYIFLCQCILSY